MTNSSKTTKSLKTAEIKRDWYIVDASQATLGRVATVIAERLIGKQKRTFTPHIDNGDFVVVINSDKINVTGRKLEQKTYYKHSGWMGGLSDKTLGEQMEDDSTRVIEMAVKGMLPKNKHQSQRLNRLKVYVDENHAHSPQKPTELGVK